MAYVILIVGVFACSTSVIFIRLSETDPVLLSAHRLLLGATVLLPATLAARKRHPEFQIRWWGGEVLIPGALLAAHFISWIYGARMTPAANATLLVNMTPAVMPLLLFAIARERVTGGEGIGTVLALIGVFALVASDLTYEGTRFAGDVVCFLSMTLYAVYLAFARRNRGIPSIYLYVVPLYYVAGLLCLGVAGVQAWTTGEIDLVGPDFKMELIAVFGLALVPTVVGHSTINWAFKHLRGQAVSIINLGQVIFASFLAAIILRELPPFNFYGAAALIIAGAVVVVRSGPRRP